MAIATTIQIRGKGTITLPIDLRRKYGLDEGDVINLIDLGDGSFLLTPVVTKVDRLGDRVAQAMAEELAAVQANLDFLVTLNRTHFIDDPAVAQKSGLRIGTPGDALHWVRG